MKSHEAIVTVTRTGLRLWKAMGVIIHRKDGQPFGFAGLWEYWKGSDGELHTYIQTENDENQHPAAYYTSCPPRQV